MMKFQAKWDNQLEKLAIKMDNCKQCNTLQQYSKNNWMVLRVRNFLNKNFSAITSLVSQCNNGQAPIISIRGKNYAMTYQNRKLLVYSLAAIPTLFHRGSFIKRYIFWSTLFCRETFNPRYYKFTYSQTIPSTVQTPQSKL